MADFYITEGDVGWELQVTVKDANDAVVDVTGFTITFKMQSLRVSTDTIDAPATFVTAASGIIKYIGLVADAALAPGFYEAEFLINPSGDATYRAPTKEKILVQVRAKVLA